MRVFKNRFMCRCAAKQRISDAELLEAVQRAENGLIDADLGGGVIKQRIARAGQGRRGCYRSIILFKSGDKAFFMLAFAKNERENITPQELVDLKNAATVMLAMSDTELTAAQENNILMEIIL